ncbi:MAG: hypothetical protein VZR54_09145 [Ruminococcus sp.]|nr:hypothetical protein [Ruminococcus sp.]
MITKIKESENTYILKGSYGEATQTFFHDEWGDSYRIVIIFPSKGTFMIGKRDIKAIIFYSVVDTFSLLEDFYETILEKSHQVSKDDVACYIREKLRPKMILSQAILKDFAILEHLLEGDFEYDEDGDSEIVFDTFED